MSYLEEDWSADSCAIGLKLNRDTITKLQIDVTEDTIRRAIIKEKKLKIMNHHINICHRRDSKGHDIRVNIELPTGSKAAKAQAKNPTELFQRVETLMRALPDIVVRGYSDANRAVITSDAKTSTNTILVEGYGLKACMTTEGVDGASTKTNSVMEVCDVLGIEAARTSIIAEIGAVMRDMEIDPRHMKLLADLMTQRGEVLGITRFGLAKMRDSVLQLASFEKTPDHLFEAAAKMKSDRIEGVSESIIMGQSMGVGTGAFKLMKPLGLSSWDLQVKATVFEDTWQKLRGTTGTGNGTTGASSSKKRDGD
jgi:DNA-directed RNA polymerase III subunit RPC1